MFKRSLPYALFAGLLSAAAPLAAQADNTTYFYAFSGADGANPIGQLSFSGTGGLYGTTRGGGPNAMGTVFKIASTPTGFSYQNIVSLAAPVTPGGMSSSGAFNGVTVEPNGTLVGTAGLDGGDLVMLQPGSGTASASQALVNPLPQFTSCAYPSALAHDAAGNMYGYAVDCRSAGTLTEVLFELSPPSAGSSGWTTTVLYTFPNANGSVAPAGSPLVTANGTIYGITRYGSPSGYTEVFQLTPPAGSQTAWSFKAIQDFTWANTPAGGLVADAAGNLYGAFDVNAGEIEMLTKPRTANGIWYISALYHFGAIANDGVGPNGTLAITPDNLLVGTTRLGGTAGEGTVFALPLPGTSGSYRVLYNFGAHSNDGTYPNDSVAVDTSGRLYGTTLMGGHNDMGSVFFMAAP